MLGGGCQVRVVIENMMGRMENLKTLISGFLGLVILVRWALVTMFLSWTTQTGCRIHRTYVSLIGSGEGKHTTHLLKCVLLLSTSQTDWKQSSDVLSDISFDILSDKSSDISSDILSDISSDILSDIFLTYLLTFFLTNLLTLFLTYLLTFFLTYLSTCFLTYLLTFFLTYQNQNLTSTASHKKPLCKLYIYLTPRSKSNIHDNFVPVNVIALSASDRPAKRQLSPNTLPVIYHIIPLQLWKSGDLYLVYKTENISNHNRSYTNWLFFVHAWIVVVVFLILFPPKIISYYIDWGGTCLNTMINRGCGPVIHNGWRVTCAPKKRSLAHLKPCQQLRSLAHLKRGHLRT